MSIFTRIQQEAILYQKQTGHKPDTVVLGGAEYKELLAEVRKLPGVPSSAHTTTIQGLTLAQTSQDSYLAVCRQDKPRWVEVCRSYGLYDPGAQEYVSIYQLDTSKYAERASIIKQMNARSEVEAFIRANGGFGKWCFLPRDNGFDVDDQIDPFWLGSLGCATCELAEELIRRFPAQLKLIGGIE